MNELIDNFQRRIDYLRISLTDRCNLRCRYCMPEEGIHLHPPEAILSYEEILKLAQIGVSIGLNNIRITGGEPLVRLGIIEFIKRLVKIPGLQDVAMTTNGVLLSDFAKDLAKIGLKRVNISLDTLNSEKFVAITRRNYFDNVLRGIEAAINVGFAPIKINMVVMRGINDDEILDFAELTRVTPIDVRFIEQMPIGLDVSAEQIIPITEMKERLEVIAPLQPSKSFGNGPAKYYKYNGAKGNIGFITPLSEHFCQQCNRLRLTPDGKLRVCLFSNLEYDVLTPLRKGSSNEQLTEIFLQAILNKPQGHGIGKSETNTVNRTMAQIGG